MWEVLVSGKENIDKINDSTETRNKRLALQARM